MKKILIVGAGFLQKYVIIKAREMGYYVHAVDADPNAVGFQYANEGAVIDIVNKEACLKYAKSKRIDGVLTAATDFGVPTVSYIAKKLNLPGLNYNTAITVRDKYAVRKILIDSQVDDAKQVCLVNKNTNFNELVTKINYPVMVKPCEGSGSRGINKVEKAIDLRNACLNAINVSTTNQAEIESFIVGDEYGCESIVIDGNIYVLAVMKKWMTKPPYYAELGHAIPSGLDISIENKIKNCVRDAILALKINSGSVNMDVLVTETGKIHIVDVGARMGGNLIGSHIIKLGTGYDYMAAIIRNAVGDKVNLIKGRQTCVATRILAFHEGIITQIPNIELLEKKYNVTIEHHMRVGDYVSNYHTNLDGCGYIVATGSDLDEVVNRGTSVLQIIEKAIFTEIDG
jgi:biotin carboxylase